MTYYLYLDESGGFTKSSDDSIVGGFITQRPPQEIQTKLEEAIARANQACGTDFAPRDLHAAPLLHPESTGNDHERARFSTIPEKSRKRLVDECLQAVIGLADHFVCSVNKGFAFSNEDAQSRYGTNLMAAVRAALDWAQAGTPSATVKVAFAPRSPKCLPSGTDFTQYHQKLATYVRDLFGVTASFSMTRNRAGFAGADIACYFLRSRKGIPKDCASYTKPNDHFVKQYHETGVSLLKQLLAEGACDQALRWAETSEQRAEALAGYEAIENAREQQRQTRDIVNYAYECIDLRAVSPGHLTRAYDIFRVTARVARNAFEADPTSRRALEAMLATLEGAVTCVNHLGMSGTQGDFERMYVSLLEEHGQLLPSRAERSERAMALRNRAYNDEFNAFDFERILLAFQDTVEKRVADSGEEKDDLTGAMCGTIGQAHAFLLRTDPIEHAEHAREWLTRSLTYLTPGQKYHDMGVNYQTTFYWEQRQPLDAIAAFAQHACMALPDGTVPERPAAQRDLICSWLTTLLESRRNEPGTPFDVLALLRLLADGLLPKKRIIESIEKWLLDYTGADHPHELLAKWVGMFHLLSNRPAPAITWLDRAIAIGEEREFAVKAVTLSAIGLRVVANALNQNSVAHDLDLALLRSRAAQLTESQPAFRLYIEAIGGIDTMERDVEQCDISAIARWMPFCYA
ncbi:MAG: hypothetical protein HN742_24365 [Lentisphaerae bacterium]|jgi:hypothetical protein|nr:hypothetical protein [Lentisphaerota bacterium]MBT4819651.1 hypothetical protein [Lentisphaerota bacterium]MBT5608947.1 hypothetical protein [Lentisphaerota bacterium]MBT7061486.1 hypothetical protein [Lentisphaerota bacterium]MBT7845034.1 hypothetical protein [Lentisphaerota bacterium]